MNTKYCIFSNCCNLTKNHWKIDSRMCFEILRISSYWWAHRFITLMHPRPRNSWKPRVLFLSALSVKCIWWHKHYVIFPWNSDILAKSAQLKWREALQNNLYVCCLSAGNGSLRMAKLVVDVDWSGNLWFLMKLRVIYIVHNFQKCFFLYNV